MSIITESNINNYKVVNGDGVDASIINDTVETAVNAYSNSQNAISTSNQAVNTANLADKKIEEFIKTEGNSVVTIGGVPQVTWSADFAESERQKSKNLLNPQWLKQGAYVFTTGTFSYDANYVTTEKISVKPNSQIVMSANIGIDPDTGFVFFNNGAYVGYAGGGAVTATVPSNANQVVFNFHATGITPQSITTPQLEYGSVATDYQPYNGAIVHTNDVVLDLIYDKETKNIINGVSYTSGLNGVSEYPINVSKYKKLKVYAYLTGVAVIFDIDLINRYGTAYKCCTAGLSDDLSDIVMINGSVGPNKDYVAFNLGFWNANGVNLRNNHNSWFVYRIEGVK